MINFIKSSYLYKIFYTLILYPFEYSLIKKIFIKIKFVLTLSKTYKIIERYINKNPYFINSYSQKIFRKIIKFLDIIANFLNKIFKTSNFVNDIKTIHRYPIFKGVNALTLCIFGLLSGYVLGLLVVFKSIVLKILLILMYLLIIYIAINIDFIKNSLFFRLCKYLYRLVKM